MYLDIEAPRKRGFLVMKDKIVQCLLESDNQRLVAWLSAERIKPGFSVTLKDSDDPTRWWKILSMSQEYEKGSIRTSHESKAIWEKDFHGRFKGLGV